MEIKNINNFLILLESNFQLSIFLLQLLCLLSTIHYSILRFSTLLFLVYVAEVDELWVQLLFLQFVVFVSTFTFFFIHLILLTSVSDLFAHFKHRFVVFSGFSKVSSWVELFTVLTTIFILWLISVFSTSSELFNV
jgi:hypothetical protein